NLVQWYNKRVKRQGNVVVMQGLVLPSHLSVATDPLLPANVCPPCAPPQPGPVHQYHPAGSTVGQAQVKWNVSYALATLAAVRSCPQQELFPAPLSGPQLFMLGPVTSQGPVLGAAPQALGASLSSAAPAPVRKRTCGVLRNTCKKCGQLRTAETGHS